ncbi:MAG: DUF664 domain-containing protein [Saprospiraceae bacterium]|nr:DUF664 domain-containing protein [Saprospiraceae bacterium]
MPTRRTIMKYAALLPLSVRPSMTLMEANNQLQDDNLNFIGPKSGYSPQVGTLVSMMAWMRNTILYPVEGMSTKDLDYLHDDQANTIGAMLYHLAATEKFYQENTFNNRSWDDWTSDSNNQWVLAMNLGDEARAKIKGHSLDFYLEKLNSVRETTLMELKKKDDEWLLKLDESWVWGPTNNYCKWFHVVEHESNHNGQIKWIKGRIPS